MDGKTEVRILMQYPQEWPVTTHMRIVQHAFEIAYGLMRMHPEK